MHGDLFDVLDYNPTWFSSVAKRGAQIIHPKDSSYIISRSGIAPGNRVLEAGIGSGALSSALLWHIGAKGKLFSFDMDESAIRIGRENLSHFQDIGNWETRIGDVKSMALPADLDCAVLDIPDPWNAISNVARSLKNGGSIVTYSPNYNQSESTVSQMGRSGVSVIETVELLKRDILVREGTTRPDHKMLGHTAFLTFGIKKSGHTTRI